MHGRPGADPERCRRGGGALSLPRPLPARLAFLLQSFLAAELYLTFSLAELCFAPPRLRPDRSLRLVGHVLVVKRPGSAPCSLPGRVDLLLSVLVIKLTGAAHRAMLISAAPRVQYYRRRQGDT